MPVNGQLRAGVHFPRSTGEFQSWFVTDADCLDYLDWLRWPEGFVCPRCGHPGGWWPVADGRYKCAACAARTSVTAGTLFDRRRTPLTVWFTACWMFATQKDGLSAQSVQRALEIGSYSTAWAMLHRLRSVLVRPGRDRLAGTVEVDETYIGGEEPGLRGGRARGKKSLVGVAIEVKQPRGYGRVRMSILADASAASLHAFVTDNVEPGATVITDAWQGYRGIEALGYTHNRHSQRAARARGEDPGDLLPGVHRVWSSTGCSNWLSHTTRCATATWSPIRSPRRRGPYHPGHEDTHLHSTAHQRRDLGETSDQQKSGQMNTPKRRNVRTRRAWLCQTPGPLLLTQPQQRRRLVARIDPLTVFTDTSHDAVRTTRLAPQGRRPQAHPSGREQPE